MADRPEVDDVGARGEAAFGRLSTALLIGALALLAAVLVALGPHDALERLAVLLRRVLPFWGR